MDPLLATLLDRDVDPRQPLPAGWMAAGEHKDNDERAASDDTSRKVGSKQRAGAETSSSGDAAQDRPGGYDGPGDPSSR